MPAKNNNQAFLSILFPKIGNEALSTLGFSLFNELYNRNGRKENG